MKRHIGLGIGVGVLAVALLWQPITTGAGKPKGLWNPLSVENQLAMLIDTITVLQSVNKDTECGKRAKQLQLILILKRQIPREIPEASYKLFAKACSLYPAPGATDE